MKENQTKNDDPSLATPGCSCPQRSESRSEVTRTIASLAAAWLRDRDSQDSDDPTRR